MFCLVGCFPINTSLRTDWPRAEREFPFPAIPGNTGLPFPFPKIGNDFFIPVPVPKSWECYFSFPFPFPKFGNAILYSRSHYREWIVRVGNKNGNGVQKVGKRGISTDEIHLLNPLTFLDLHIIQFAISIWQPWLVATSCLTKLRATHTPKLPW